MTPLEQQAESRKYSSAHKCWIVQLEDEAIALFGPDAKLLAVCHTPEELVEAFFNRPAYIPPPPRLSKSAATTDLLEGFSL